MENAVSELYSLFSHGSVSEANPTFFNPFFLVQKISVIIPTFNSLTHLEETLNSVLLQDYANFECIIIDDGSTDETENLVRNYTTRDARIFYWKRPENLPKGPSSCRNYGAEKAVGDFIVFLDADDLLASYCLKNRISQFEQHPECDFLVFQMQRFVQQPDFSKTVKAAQKDPQKIVKSFLNLHGEWQITSPIYKTGFFRKIGFNPDLVVFEDLELAIRAIVFAADFKVFDEVDCYYRNDENYQSKYETIEVKTRMVNGFKVLLQSLKSLMETNPGLQFDNESIRHATVQSYKRLFLGIILNNAKLFRSDNKELLVLLSKYHFLTSSDRLRMRFAHQIILPFANIKGTGISRVIQMLYK